MKQGLEALDHEVIYASVDYFPLVFTTISEEEEKKLLTILQKLEDIDSVMKLHVNL